MINMSSEAENQMTEEGRKQWLSRHLSRGKALEKCISTYKWLVAHRMVSKVRGHKAWVEPFSISNTNLGDESTDIITSLEAINLLVFIVRLKDDNPSWFLDINFDDIRHELRSDAYELICCFDKQFVKQDIHNQKEQVESLLESMLKTSKDSSTFERAYEEVLNNTKNAVPFKGSPYIEEEEILSKVNYTDTAATYLRFLISLYPITISDADYDTNFREIVVKHIISTINWFSSNYREYPDGGIGWGWAGFLNGQEEELSKLYCLDADVCVPQTYFSSQVIDSLVSFLDLLAQEGVQFPEDVLAKKPVVKNLIKDALEGLVFNNKVGDGWVDYMPYHPTKGTVSKSTLIEPFGYSEETPSLLHTAYVIKTVTNIISKKNLLDVEPEYIESIEKSIKWLLKGLSSTGISNLKDQSYKHVLSRLSNGNELAVFDDTGLYQVFGALSSYTELLENRDALGLSLPDLQDYEKFPYYEMAEYILNNLIDVMYEKGGFPPTGNFVNSDVRKLPGIRATKVALEAFAAFGLNQMVPTVDDVIDRHLLRARNEILNELVVKYGALEAQGVRVAWGLIENANDEINKAR